MTISLADQVSIIQHAMGGRPLFKAPAFTEERRKQIDDIKTRLAAGNGTLSTEYRTYYHMIGTAICEQLAEEVAKGGQPDETFARLEKTSMEMCNALVDQWPTAASLEKSDD